MKLSLKLILLSTLLMIMSITISLTLLYRMSDINIQTQELATNWLPSMKLAAQMNITASEEQSAASEEINHSIINVSDMVNDTSSSMSSAMTAIKELKNESQNLNNLIVSLKMV